MKNCKFCDKTGLLVLPLRYAAVAADNAKALLPELPATLGAGVKDLALSKAQYAPRLLREGYLYVLLQRQGVKYWEAYASTGDAFLYKFNSDTPPLAKVEFTCDISTCGIDASCIAIDKVEFVDKVYFLFTPSALSVAKLNEYKDKADALVAKGQMQVFDPKAWAKAGSRAQAHSLKPELLDTQVPEWMLYKTCGAAQSSPLGQALKRQLFAATSSAYAGVPAPAPDQAAPGRLGQLQHKLKRLSGAAFVIHDPIGITQELNDFRNAPLEGLEHYLAATDEYGASNQQRLQVYEAIEEIKAGLYSGIVNDSQQFLALHQASSDQFFERRRSQAGLLRAQGREVDAAAIESDVDRSLKVRAANYQAEIERAKATAAKNWKDKYEDRLDLDEMKAFYAALNSRSKAAFEAAASRVEDHLKWFESDRLVGAFDIFDKTNISAGYNFAMESAICSLGLSSCKLGEDKIDAWINAPQVERKNLYMRGLYYNNDELIAAAKQAFADIRAAAEPEEFASGIAAAHMIRATKGLVDGFKKIDSAFDEWARNQGQVYSRRWGVGREVVLYHKFSDITRTVFRAGVGGTFDKLLTARLSGWLYARLGSVTEHLAFNEAMLTIPKEKIASHRAARAEKRAEGRRMDKAADKAAKVVAKVDGSLETLIADAQDKARQKALTLNQIRGKPATGLPTNNYHQTRLGVLLGCIEMIALGEKLTHFENNTKGWLEVGGSTMAVGSIVLDTYYSAAKSIREIQPYQGINAINKGADIVRGGFKLGAGVLGFGEVDPKVRTDLMAV